MRLSVLEKQNSICKSQKQSVAGVLSGGVNVWEFGRESECTGVALCEQTVKWRFVCTLLGSSGISSGVGMR